MSPENLTRIIICCLLLTAGLAASAAEEVIVNGIDVDVRRTIDSGPQRDPEGDIGQDVQALGADGTNDGGVPDEIVNPREAAIEGEPNLGPNAPGYIR
ncbi:MAG TPA: hypothetical protein VES73_03455 [Lamprocystis sp. (in: g-proteobacteria)]|nr:hypothetical protein [Lamprocystis sp. (in: g-proteobacteria)]